MLKKKGVKGKKEKKPKNQPGSNSATSNPKETPKADKKVRGVHPAKPRKDEKLHTSGGSQPRPDKTVAARERSNTDAIRPSKTTKIEPKMGIYDWVDLPAFELQSLTTSGRFLQLSGPEANQEGGTFECWEPFAAGKSVSNYPIKRITQDNKIVRMGDPIADYFLTRIYVNRCVIALADGCGWGQPARDASKVAANTFLSYLDARHADMISVRDAGRLILRAFSEAHNKILKSYADIWESGTTTMLAGLLLELKPEEEEEQQQAGEAEENKKEPTSKQQQNGHGPETGNDSHPGPSEEVVAASEEQQQQMKAKEAVVGDESSGKEKEKEEDDKGKEKEDKVKDKEGEENEHQSSSSGSSVRWVFVCASVGDCKALHYSRKTGEVTDITLGNRMDLRSPTDPGGRLGAMVGDGAPDLRNLFVHFCPCEEGDLLILMSDGIHDNLDPVTRGLDPEQIGISAQNWSEVNDEELLQKKSKFMKEEVEKIMSGLPKSPLTGVPLPQVVASALIQTAKETCASSVEWMESKPDEHLPEDAKQYPGKMDHATCLCIHVGYHLLFSNQ